MAIWSLAQATTSGAGRSASSLRAAAAPLASEKSPSRTGSSTQPGCPATACRKVSRRSRASGESAGPGQEAEAAVTVIPDQVRSQRLHPGGVVHRHDIQFRLVPAACDPDHRDPPGQRPQLARRHYFFGDQQPVDLAGQRPDPPLERLACAPNASSSEQSVPRSTDSTACTSSSMNRGLVFSMPTSVTPRSRAARPMMSLRRRPALGRAVGHVAQFLDHGQHPVAGVRVDEVGAVDHPGHGRRGHPGPVRHLIDGAHRGTLGAGGPPQVVIIVDRQRLIGLPAPPGKRRCKRLHLVGTSDARNGCKRCRWRPENGNPYGFITIALPSPCRAGHLPAS